MIVTITCSDCQNTFEHTYAGRVTRNRKFCDACLLKRKKTHYVVASGLFGKCRVCGVDLRRGAMYCNEHRGNYPLNKLKVINDNELRKFIEVQVNGGITWDEPNFGGY